MIRYCQCNFWDTMEQQAQKSSSDTQKRILIVEDSYDAGFILKKRIEKLYPDAQVEWSQTSLGAQRFLYENDVDLVFLDLNLDDSYGVESVRDIKPYAKQTPIIVMTGIANQLTVEECLKAGAAELVLKINVSKEYLEATIKKHTDYLVDEFVVDSEE